MAIEFQHGIDVGAPPERVFALLDDLAQTPRWLARCTGIEKLTPGENAVGTELRYAYRDGRRRGTMLGRITARTPAAHLAFHYGDRMMDVSVDFRMGGNGAGTHLVHTIGITPRNFFARLFSPLIRRALPAQTIGAMEKLRSLLG
ncbi:MAG: SRPBCC family protein [Myxococcota bacterium]